MAGVFVLAEQHLAALRDIQLLKADWVEIRLDAAAFRVRAIHFVAAAIDLGLAQLPAVLGQLGLTSRPSFGETAVRVGSSPARLRVVMNYRRGLTVGPIG